MANVISGLAVPFNVVDGPEHFRERVSPTALDRTLAAGGRDGIIFAQVNHDYGRPIGNTKAGNVRLWKSSDGLHFEVSDLDGTAEQRDAYTNVSRRIVPGVSIGFLVKDEEFAKENGTVVRTLLDLELIEFSLVTTPWYRTTYVQAGMSPRRAEFAAQEQRRYELKRNALAARMAKWPTSGRTDVEVGV